MHILLKFWKEILLAVLIGMGGYLIYDKLVTIGVNKGKQELTLYKSQLDEKISTLEDFSRVIIVQNENTTKLLRADMSAILAEAKTKPVFVLKDGKCTLSTEFVDSYNSVIDRANAK